MKESGYNTFQLSDRVQALQNATHGELMAIDKGYVEDVRKRIPEIEKALADLKKFLEVKTNED